MAVTDRAAAQHGISAFVIEKGTPGFRCGKKENKLGLRASATGEVIFENCRLAPEQLLGKLNDGFVASLKVLDGGRISIAALSIGMAQGAYDAALKYSKLRKQFGRPISEFQAIQHKLVDMAVDIDAARLLNYRAAWMLDRGMRVTRESAMAKLFASEAAVRIARRGGADPRRLRLHQGLPGGEVLPRREALHHRRRHQRDPAPGDRPATPEKLMTELARKNPRRRHARACSRLATGIENRDPAGARNPARTGAARRPRAHRRHHRPARARARARWWTRSPLALRKQGKTLAILAVDPSSRVTGGAILGDRIRMQQHHADPGIFIRSMATRGTIGGLARATADLARLMDAAGRDYVLIETVGVGPGRNRDRRRRAGDRRRAGPRHG